MNAIDVVALLVMFPMGGLCGWIAGFHHGAVRRHRRGQHLPGRW